jgi:deoxyribose-phosphate aldolase
MKALEQTAPVAVQNPGTPLDLDWIKRVPVNSAEIEKSAQSLVARAGVTSQSTQDLLRAISVMDLTTLADDDTEERVRKLCARARQPLPAKLVARLCAEAKGLHVAAVCIYDRFVPAALQELQGTGIRVATVSADFPKGIAPLEDRIAQVHRSVEAGAHEIDVVIKREHVLKGDWQTHYDEVAAFKAACRPRLMKVILATGELENIEKIARASIVAMMAGADFIKTSTGKETVNATVPAAIAMTRAIRDYARKTKISVGFKPAGGIRTAKQALEYLELVREELSEQWLHPNLFRIGASSVLDDIERTLDRIAT